MPNSPIDVITEGAGNAPAHAESHGRRVRVLHLIAGNLYGGVETLLVTLARFRSLCPGMDPCFGLCYEGRLSRELRAADAPVYMLGNARIGRPWTAWRSRRNLRAVLDSERFDVVICHMAWAMAMFGGTARATGAKVLFWAHGVQTGRDWLERLARRTVPDLAVANSRFTAGSLSNLYQNVPVSSMYYPVAPPDSAQAEHWRASARREQGVSDDTVVILQASRLEPWKGHLLHLRALSLLKDSPSWVCWVAGGPQTEKEEKYFEQLHYTAKTLGIADRVRFLGQRSDIPQLLSAADIFCQPNEGPEPFGIVFLEALWMSRPVVTTAMGGPLEIIDETCGLLVEPSNVEALAAQLRQLIDLTELRERLGRGGPSRAFELCDPANQLMKLRKLVLEVIGLRN